MISFDMRIKNKMTLLCYLCDNCGQQIVINPYFSHAHYLKPDIICFIMQHTCIHSPKQILPRV